MRLDVIGDSLCAQVTASAFAMVGNNVCWWLPSGALTQRIQEEVPAFAELELHQCFLEQLKSGRLRVENYDDLPGDMSSATVFLALQPGELSQAIRIVDCLACQSLSLLVNQGVFPIGTTGEFQSRLDEHGSSARVVALPDLLQEGRALNGFTRSGQVLLLSLIHI